MAVLDNIVWLNNIAHTHRVNPKPQESQTADCHLQCAACSLYRVRIMCGIVRRCRSLPIVYRVYHPSSIV